MTGARGAIGARHAGARRSNSKLSALALALGPIIQIDAGAKSAGEETIRAGMAAGWQVEDRCPQCGALVALNETDRLLSCAYCQVRLYVATDGPPRYCLPVKPVPAGDLVMVPYWRVRALHYR